MKIKSFLWFKTSLMFNEYVSHQRTYTLPLFFIMICGQFFFIIISFFMCLFLMIFFLHDFVHHNYYFLMILFFIIFVHHALCWTWLFFIIFRYNNLRDNVGTFKIRISFEKQSCFPSGFFDEILDIDTHRLVEHSTSLSSAPFILKVFHYIYYRIAELNFFNFQTRKEDSVNLHFESPFNGQRLVVPINFSWNPLEKQCCRKFICFFMRWTMNILKPRGLQSLWLIWSEIRIENILLSLHVQRIWVIII